MRELLSIFITLLFCSSLAIAGDGLISIKSAHGVPETADRLEATLKAKGMTIFSRIKHSEAASKLGKKLRPTELMLFGNPIIGTALMQCRQSIGIDLPQKALIWEDEKAQVWLSYNDPLYLAERHDVEGCEPVLNKMVKALKHFAKAATTP